MKIGRTAVLAVMLSVAASDGNADDSDLAKQLSNPIASLISVPFQYNYDHGFGSEDGNKSVVNLQPVIPLSLNDDWNLISRTIIPVVWQNDAFGQSGRQFGVGDIGLVAWIAVDLIAIAFLSYRGGVDTA